MIGLALARSEQMRTLLVFLLPFVVPALTGCRGTSWSLNCLDEDETEVCTTEHQEELCECVKKATRADPKPRTPYPVR